MTTGYLRFPHLHEDLLTFTAANDIWLAPITGGRAWRITHDGAPVLTPRFSPDGSKIAWISNKEGHPEVYVYDRVKGHTRRLTYWGATSNRVVGWADNDHVLASSTKGAIITRGQWIHRLGLDGSDEILPFGIAQAVAQHRDGATVVATASRPPAWWKRYRGGTAQQLWLRRSADAQWERLLGSDTAGLVDPMWIGQSLVFVSDREADLADNPDGQGNLWAMNPLAAKPKLRQITHQGAAQGYVRDATTDGRRIVWHTRGELYLLDKLVGAPRRIEIELPNADVAPISVAPTDQLGVLHPVAHGELSLATWRGAAVRITHRGGPIRLLHSDESARIRELLPAGDRPAAVAVRHHEGVDRLVEFSLQERTNFRVLAEGIGRILHVAASPDGSVVATISHDGVIRVTGGAGRSKAGKGRSRTVEVARSPFGEATGLAFSPDGRYLVWAQPTMGEAEHRQIMGCDLGAGLAKATVVELTSGRFDDHNPVFSSDGKHLIFLSARTFDPRYDDHSFDLSFASSTRPWLIPLAATTPSPFDPQVEGWAPVQPDHPDDRAESGPDSGKNRTKVMTSAIDLDGFEERIVPFPVPSGKFRSLQPSNAGVVWIRRAESTGVLGSIRAAAWGEDRGDALETWQWERRRAEVLVEAVDDAQVSGDGKTIVCRHKDSVTVRPTDRRMETDDPDLVQVDLQRLRRTIDPRREWRQMFAENAAIMAEHYWRADLDGVDWAEVTRRYEIVLDRVLTRDDLVDLLWECVGELNTSHAYVIPPIDTETANLRLGHLGADLVKVNDGWKIDRILPGESSDPAARSPLRAAGVDARPGDLIVAVDGQPVDPTTGPAALLCGARERPVEITLRRGTTEREVAITPIAEEFTLRYQDWVRGRAALVERESHGRLGYLHIPDMQSIGWAQIHRDIAKATQAEGLVVDVRFNGGGHTSQLVLERLARKVIGWCIGRHFEQPMSYPHSALRGPLVLVADRFSGSDGDIVNAAAQAMGLGVVIGERTWGGVVGIDGRFTLVDGTAITQPRYAHWFENYQWGVENHGVDPDIELVNSPSDWHYADGDRQLLRAIEELLAALEQQPAAEAPPVPPARARRS